MTEAALKLVDPQFELIERFRNFGMDINHGDNRSDVVASINAMDEGDLWLIFDDLKVSGSVGFSANGRIRKTTLAYIFTNLFETGSMTVDQAMVDVAVEKATNLCESLFGKAFANADPGQTIDADDDNDDSTQTVTRKRDPNLFPRIKRWVRDNPDASVEDAVSSLSDTNPNTAESTLRNYVYKARKELGMKSNGKRGRKKTDTFDRVRVVTVEMREQNSDVSVVDIAAEVCSRHPDIAEGTAKVYIYKALKEM